MKNGPENNQAIKKTTALLPGQGDKKTSKGLSFNLDGLHRQYLSLRFMLMLLKKDASKRETDYDGTQNKNQKLHRRA